MSHCKNQFNLELVMKMAHDIRSLPVMLKLPRAEALLVLLIEIAKEQETRILMLEERVLKNGS